MRAQQYSARLGSICDAQFQQALDVFGLGRFVRAQPVSQGLFGQNVYVTSTAGEFVLRGKPHYDWQFRNEKLFADLLHGNTQAPVPHPYLLDTDTRIFGWEYVIMPRLRGRNLSDDLDDDNLGDADRLEIARAQGRVLAEAQRLTGPYCGQFDMESQAIKPAQPDWLTVFAGQTMDMLVQAAHHSANTPNEDLDWARQVVAEAASYLDPFEPAFVMQDFKPGNMVVDLVGGSWEVTGLFDLMEARFGHPESDVSRLWAVYTERGREDLAYAFVNAYLPQAARADRFAGRFPLFILHDRAIIWEWVQRSGRAWWDKRWTLRQWASRSMTIDPARIAAC